MKYNPAAAGGEENIGLDFRDPDRNPLARLLISLPTIEIGWLGSRPRFLSVHVVLYEVLGSTAQVYTILTGMVVRTAVGYRGEGVCQVYQVCQGLPLEKQHCV